MHIEIRNAAFALCAVLFAVTGLLVMAIYGSHATRSLCAGVALVGCMSQFIGQDPSIRAQRVSIALSYIAFALALVALIVFAF